MTRTKISDKTKIKTKIVRDVKTTRQINFKFILDDHSSPPDSYLRDQGEDHDHVAAGPHDVRGEDSAGRDEGAIQPSFVSEFGAALQLTAPLKTTHLSCRFASKNLQTQ